jgi:hypothetical protein
MAAGARRADRSHPVASSARKAAVNAFTREGEQARHRFAAVDLAMPALVESSESMWPTLPPARSFELSDELAAMDREAETLRRLDREQRGTLWNA